MTGLPLGDEDGDGIDKPIGREVIVVSVLLLCCLLSFLSSPLVAFFENFSLTWNIASSLALCGTIHATLHVVPNECTSIALPSKLNRKVAQTDTSHSSCHRLANSIL